MHFILNLEKKRKSNSLKFQIFQNVAGILFHKVMTYPHNNLIKIYL